jgi:hypothetical protein
MGLFALLSLVGASGLGCWLFLDIHRRLTEKIAWLSRW